MASDRTAEPSRRRCNRRWRNAAIAAPAAESTMKLTYRTCRWPIVAASPTPGGLAGYFKKGKTATAHPTISATSHSRVFASHTPRANSSSAYRTPNRTPQSAPYISSPTTRPPRCTRRLTSGSLVAACPTPACLSNWMARSITGSARTRWNPAATAPATRPARIPARRQAPDDLATTVLVAREPRHMPRIVDQLVEQVHVKRHIALEQREEEALVE